MLTVIESAAVMHDTDLAARQWPRFHEAWSALIWVLSRDPTVGNPLREDGRLRSIAFEGSIAHEMPTINAVYRIDAHFVLIETARFTDPMHSAGTG